LRVTFAGDSTAAIPNTEENRSRHGWGSRDEREVLYETSLTEKTKIACLIRLLQTALSKKLNNVRQVDHIHDSAERQVSFVRYLELVEADVAHAAVKRLGEIIMLFPSS
jgi:hypothetical protein